jgi:hypothetical protein
MQNHQRCSRLSFVSLAHIDLPRPVHWILNGVGALCLAAPHVFSFLSWYLLVWGVDMLQSVFGMAGAGAVFALLDTLKFAMSVFALALGLEIWTIRAEWTQQVYKIIDDCCEEFPSLR